MDKIKYLKDHIAVDDEYRINNPKRIDSKIEFFNDATGERIWEPLHNKTVIAGSAITAMKLFNLDRNVLDATPTYDKSIGGTGALSYGTNVEVISAADGTTYPTAVIKNSEGVIIGSIHISLLIIIIYSTTTSSSKVLYSFFCISHLWHSI